MEDVSGSGRTVIFVSHNMGTILSLCSRCIFLKNSTINFDSDPREAVRRYLEEAQPTLQFRRPLHKKSGDPTLVEGSLQTEETKDGDYLLNLVFTIESDIETGTCFNISTKDSMGQKVGFSSLGSFNSEDMLKLRKGKNSFSVS